MIEFAISVAAAAHRGQFDKGGEPYIYHPLRVMLAVKDLGTDAACAAVLHDVVEDTYLNSRDITTLGFSDNVKSMVTALTRRRLESYQKYIARIAAGPQIVREIKIADLRDNLSKDRVGCLPLSMVKRYALALQTLTDYSNYIAPEK